MDRPSVLNPGSKGVYLNLTLLPATVLALNTTTQPSTGFILVGKAVDPEATPVLLIRGFFVRYPDETSKKN